MEQPLAIEKEPKDKVSDFLAKNSDLPTRIIEDIISTNKLGFDTMPIDIIESKSESKIDRLSAASSLSLVHLTDAQEVEGKILPRSELSQDLGGKHRSTVHMTLGYPV